MSDQVTIFLSTAVAMVLITYTLVILANTTRYVLGNIRKGVLMQLLGLFMVALGFLWGAIHLLLGWSDGRYVTQLFLFIGIVFMFFATRHLFSMEKPTEGLPSRVLPHVNPGPHAST